MMLKVVIGAAAVVLLSTAFLLRRFRGYPALGRCATEAVLALLWPVSRFRMSDARLTLGTAVPPSGSSAAHAFDSLLTEL